MTNYTIRMTTSTVVNDEWEAHYDFLDDIPGSTLIENPDAPELIFDVDAENWNKAQIFTLGLASLLDLNVTNIEMLEERPSVGNPLAPHVEMVDNWVAASPRQDELVGK